MWIRNKGSSLFNIDPDRVGVTGGSAGGYLTLMSGFVTDPPPKALVPFYGYGDISGPWYSKPSPFYCQQPLVAEAVARGAVGGRVISETGMTPDNRDSFYRYCRQQGLWPKEVTGHDPETEPAAFDPFTPVRNVTERYPPTLLFHGDMDTDVPYELSVMMADKLSEIGIENELVTISGGAHGFDAAGIVDPVVADTFDRALAFFKKYV